MTAIVVMNMYLFKVIIVTLVWIISFAVNESIFNLEGNWLIVYGGAIGSFCSLILSYESQENK